MDKVINYLAQAKECLYADPDKTLLYIQFAIRELRLPEPESKPLTEAELEQRIGCPVYLVYPGDTDENRWDILTDIEKGIDGYDQYSETAWFTEYEWENLEFIGKHWLAYDCPPKEAT